MHAEERPARAQDDVPVVEVERRVVLKRGLCLRLLVFVFGADIEVVGLFKFALHALARVFGQCAIELRHWRVKMQAERVLRLETGDWRGA